MTCHLIKNITCRSRIPFCYNPSQNMGKIFLSVDSPYLNGLKSERQRIFKQKLWHPNVHSMYVKGTISIYKSFSPDILLLLNMVIYW